MRDIRDGREEFDGLVDLHGQHVTDVFAAPRNRQRLRIEALAMTDVARHLHVRQEAHANGAHALAFTGRAAAFACIEREARGRIATSAGFQRAGEQLTDGIPYAYISSGTGARRFADWRLVDF